MKWKNVWWSRYPRWVSTHTHARTHAHTHTHTHAHTFTTLNSLPSVWLPAERVHTPSWQPMDSAHSILPCSRFIPTIHTTCIVSYFMFVCHDCLAWLSCWWRQQSGTIERQPLMTSSLAPRRRTVLKIGQTHWFVLMTDECERVTQSCVLLYVLFGLCWSEDLCLWNVCCELVQRLLEHVLFYKWYVQRRGGVWPIKREARLLMQPFCVW